MTMPCLQVERPVQLFTLRNLRDMRVTVSEHGAALVSWWAPDRYGRMADVLLGYPGDDGYARNDACLGAVVERTSRVNEALAGAAPRLHARHWRGELVDGGAGLRLRPAAADHADGAAAWSPGSALVEVCYRLADDGSLSIEVQALALAPAVLGLGSHACFNLNGGRADVRDHMLQIDADCYLEALGGAGDHAGDGGSGTGWREAAVSGTPFDFRRPAAIGPRLRWPHDQIGRAGGFDHCYRVGAAPGMGTGGEGGAGGVVGRPLRQVATIHDPGSGRSLQVLTTEAGLRFYSGNRLGGVAGRGAKPYAPHAGFCLEAGALRTHGGCVQAAGVLLRAGEVYRQATVYRLSLQA